MKMMIDGKRVDAKDNASIPVLNSATQELIDAVPAAAKEDVLNAIAAAQAGKKAWGGTPQYRRSEILVKCADAIDRNLHTLACMLTTEMGKIITEARAEIDCTAQIFRGFAEMANHFYGQTMSEFQRGSETDIIFTKHEPLGVVACITPFNYPAELCYHKAAAALAAGNAVIIKPATDNPLTVMRIAELCWEAGVPGNVLQVVTGEGQKIGRVLAEAEGVDKISLTGSTEVGVEVAALAARTLKRLSLELGGNDPFIVFEDADMDLAAAEAVAGRLKNAGQTCVAPKRFIVQNTVYDEFVEKAIDSLKKVKLGSPFGEDTQMGSLISVKAAQKVLEQVKLTVAQGAKCVYGGHVYDQSYFEPTVLTGVTKDMDIAVHMEVFGPVLPVIGFDTFDEAIEIANNTPFGLQAGVMSRDSSKAIRAASGLKAGAVVINGSGNYRNIDQPFGGVKMSGMGREGVSCTLSEMTQVKSYVLKRIMAGSDSRGS